MTNPRLVFTALSTTACHGDTVKSIHRAAVPGGWLVRQGNSTVYVPDADHEWEAAHHLHQVNERRVQGDVEILNRTKAAVTRAEKKGSVPAEILTAIAHLVIAFADDAPITAQLGGLAARLDAIGKVEAQHARG